ncbi:MAG: amino acid ABC transporter substrate-binding protein, partial [Desulfobacteraceae bacterium 4572_35.1]
MVKYVKLLSFFLAAVMMFSGSTLWAADQSMEKIKNKGCFVLGLDDSFPPMGFRDATGKVVGFDIDLAREVAKRLGVKLKIQPVEWSGVILSLNRGDIDLVWNGMTIKPERAKRIDFSKPYLANTQAIAVLVGSNVQHKTDLAGKKIG